MPGLTAGACIVWGSITNTNQVAVSFKVTNNGSQSVTIPASGWQVNINNNKGLSPINPLVPGILVHDVL